MLSATIDRLVALRKVQLDFINELKSAAPNRHHYINKAAYTVNQLDLSIAALRQLQDTL